MEVLIIIVHDGPNIFMRTLNLKLKIRELFLQMIISRFALAKV